MRHAFHRFAHRVSTAAGSPWAFITAVTAVLAWALAGPSLGFSTSWQLFINTGTTILTFLMVFIIQNTQNREAQATQLKLDELIRAIEPARDSLIDIEEMDDEELAELHREFTAFRTQKISEIKKKREMGEAV
jgi:low affinity Fe/Cu permease